MFRSVVFRLVPVVFATAVSGSLAAAPPEETERPRFEGEVAVVRLLVDVRVLDRAGDPIPDLGATDFVVEVDGEPAEVEAVDWFAPQREPDATPEPWVEPPTGADGLTPPQPGRLAVVLVQTGWDRSRTMGLFWVSQRTEQMLEGFGPSDRVALAVFMSHLEIHHDFTADLDAIRDGLKITSVLRRGVTAEAGPWPSLVEHLDTESAWDAATVEEALEVLAVTLEPLPGRKEILLVGWGIGTFTRTGVKLGDDWRRAFEALSRARTSVFALDITDASYHSLEFGLKAAAADTGGIYLRMADFPDLAIDRLNRALGGRYELSVVVETPTDRGWYDVAVDVDRPGTRVLAAPVAVAHGESSSAPSARQRAGR